MTMNQQMPVFCFPLRTPKRMLTIDLTLGLTSSILSFVFFCLVRYLIHPLTYYRLSPQKPDQRTSTSPKVHTWLTYPNEERWQRLNLLISWIHAVITGVLVLYSFWAYASDLQRDFVHHHSLVTYLTCSFSFGECTSWRRWLTLR